MIYAEKLTMKFENYTALSDLTCTIPDSCIYGLVGSNGAGKSTFLRLACGVYRPSSGIITYDGQPVYNNPDVKNDIVFVSDELYFLPGSNLKAMASFYASAYKNFNKKRFSELSEAFGLDIKKNINTFSKGMKRQAATILALSTMPKYVFFDESFDGLDPIMRNFVKKIIYNDVIERGTTTIITSHSLRELEDTCDQLALLHKGGIVFESDIQNLKTSLFKVQIALPRFYDRSTFAFMDENIVNYSQNGSVANIIIRGDKDEITKAMYSLSPSLMDILPLSLEEVFIYEMEALGYKFNDVLKGES